MAHDPGYNFQRVGAQVDPISNLDCEIRDVNGNPKVRLTELTSRNDKTYYGITRFVNPISDCKKFVTTYSDRISWPLNASNGYNIIALNFP